MKINKLQDTFLSFNSFFLIGNVVGGTTVLLMLINKRLGELIYLLICGIIMCLSYAHTKND